MKEDMKELGLLEEDTKSRVRWRQRIRCGDPETGRRPKVKEEEAFQNGLSKAKTLSSVEAPAPPMPAPRESDRFRVSVGGGWMTIID